MSAAALSLPVSVPVPVSVSVPVCVSATALRPSRAALGEMVPPLRRDFGGDTGVLGMGRPAPSSGSGSRPISALARCFAASIAPSTSAECARMISPIEGGSTIPSRACARWARRAASREAPITSGECLRMISSMDKADEGLVPEPEPEPDGEADVAVRED
jgi:hypothetical protein